MNTDLLTGTVYRGGRTINSIHSGILENATTMSLRAGRELSDDDGVYGIASLDAISRVGTPHSVTLQIRNDTEITPITLTGTSYTATTVTYTNTVDLANVKTGSTITAFDSPTHTGIITAVDEATKTVTIGGGWRPFTGIDGATGTPTNGVDASIDYFGKIWGQNTNVELKLLHPTKKTAGYEMGVLNKQANVQNIGLPLFGTASDSRVLWGFDAISLGEYDASAGFVSRAGNSQWLSGFVSYGNKIGFHVAPKSGEIIDNGFVYDAGEGNALLARDANGLNTARISWDGDVEMGSTSAASDRFYDFHSSGNSNDYDVRFAVSGGAAANGQGDLAIQAATISFNGLTRPKTDNAVSLGAPARRWSDIYGESLRFGAGSTKVVSGAGSPEGVVEAVVGSLYTNTTGGAGTTLYVKESGSGSTGWVAK